MYVNAANCEDLTGLTEFQIKKLTGIGGYTSQLAQWHVHFTKDYQFPYCRVILIGDGKLKISRLFDFANKNIWNEYLELPGDKRKNGIGFKIFESQINEAMSAGFKLIRCTAARNKPGERQMDGYIAWAKVGYSMQEISISRYSTKLNEHSIEFQPLHDLVYCPMLENGDSGENFWVTYGCTWQAQFDIQRDSLNHTLLNRYKDKKRMVNN